MSVTNTKAKSVYNANGTTTEWNLGFAYDNTVSNVHIYIVDANDNETEVTSNYSIAEGVLTYPTTASGLDPLAEGNKLVIVRDTPRTQDIELTSNGKLDGKVLEGGYDKLTLQVQELTEQVNRAVKIPVTEDSADNFLDPITAITEAKKEALAEIAQTTEPAETAKDTAVEKAQVATEQAAIATNAATSAKAAQAGAETAEQNATAQAEKAENAVTAFVEGLGTAKNAVIDLGTFDGKASVTSSRVIEFDRRPIAVSLRFSDTNKKLWINGTNSTVGIEVVDDTHCNLFYSIASADFVGQNAVKGPFVVQAVIQYSVLDNPASEQEEGAIQLATKAEAEAGTNDTKAMTPLKTKYAIEANATVKTLRNDVDDLGDQVAAIESKIPAEATAANQLADKAFVTEKTDELAADIAALDADKQDKITDLDAIRAGAAKGATALQSYTETDPTVPSYVKAITQDNISAWNAKQPAGDYATKEELATKQDKGDYATNTALTTGLNSKQNTLTTAQLNAVNSGITSAKVTSYDEYATTKQDKLTAGTNITISANNVISATGGGAAPTNMVTTDTFQEITASKTFTDTVKVNQLLQANRIQMLNNVDVAIPNGTTLQLGNYLQKAILQASNLNIDTTNPNSGGVGPATLNGKQIATVDDVSKAGGDDGIKGDYCTSYGILEAPNGILTNPSGMQVTLKQGVVMQLAGQDIKTTVSGDMTQTLTSTADCDLFYVSGTTSLREVAQIVWSKMAPDNGQTGVLAWWNPDNKKWKFKSNDTGNVWAEAVATPVAHIHTDGTTITRIDHIGYRVMDDEIYALKSDVGGSGRPLGEVYFSQSSLASDNPGALPGWTGEYYENGKTLFPDLYNFVKAHSELQVTKAEYDSAITSYGECPKYVVDENGGTTGISTETATGYNITIGDISSTSTSTQGIARAPEISSADILLTQTPKVGDFIYFNVPTTDPVVEPADLESAGEKCPITKVTYTEAGVLDTIAWTSDDYATSSPSYKITEISEISITNFPITTPGTSLRLPKYANYIKMAGTEGITQKGAGLPNITGSATTWSYENNLNPTGAFGQTLQNVSSYNASDNKSGSNLTLDASKSNAIYGASDTVTPAHTTLYPWISAYTSAVPASTAQAAEFTGALSGKANTDLSNVLANIDYVVESQVNSDGSWYRKYKSGWLEQGNSSPTGDQNFTLNKTITFPKPFADNTYTLVGPGFFISSAGAQTITRTTTGFTTSSVVNETGCVYWYACGQGAN